MTQAGCCVKDDYYHLGNESAHLQSIWISINTADKAEGSERDT